MADLAKQCAKSLTEESGEGSIQQMFDPEKRNLLSAEEIKTLKEKFKDHVLTITAFGQPDWLIENWEVHYENMKKAKILPALMINCLWNFHLQHPGAFNKKWLSRFEEDWVSATKVGVSDNILMTLIHYTEEMGMLRRENDHAMVFMKRVEGNEEVDPYVRNLFRGIIEIDAAWEARGGGYANTVTEEGWKGFSLHLDQAEKALEQAWSLRPKIVRAPYEMMDVALGKGTLEDSRTWFDRAVASRLEYSPAYDAMYWALMPRWQGSHDLMLDFAKECFNQGMYETRVPIEFSLLAHTKMMSDFESAGDLLRAPRVYQEAKSMILSALKRTECEHQYGYLRFYLLGMAICSGQTDEVVAFLPEMPSDPFPPSLRKFFKEVVTMIDLLISMKKEGANNEVLVTRAKLLMKVKSKPGEVLDDLVKNATDSAFHLVLLESLEFTTDQEYNNKLIAEMKRFDRVELGLMRLKHFRDDGATEEEVKILASALKELASPFDIATVLMLPTTRSAGPELCLGIFDQMATLAPQYQVNPEQLALAQFRLVIVMEKGDKFKDLNVYRNHWGKTIQQIKNYGALLDFVVTWGVSQRTFAANYAGDFASWFMFINKGVNTEAVDDFFTNWKPDSDDAKEKLVTFLRREGSYGTTLEVATRLKGTPCQQVGEEWVLRLEQWWDRTLATWRSAEMVLSYRAMQCFLMADGYQSIARKYALRHEPLTKSNSGKFLSAYLHLNANNPKLATKALVNGKHSPFKDSGNFFLPGKVYKNPGQILEDLLPQVTSHPDLQPEDLQTLKNEFPQFF